MNKYFFISILVSVLISGLFSYFLFNGKISFLTSDSSNINQVEYYQPGAPGEILSVRGTITEIVGDEYVINTNEGVEVAVRVNSETTYATSFSPTPAEYGVLYGTATSTSDGKPLPQKLKLKLGDRIEATYSATTSGKSEFVATGIKLIR